MEPFRDYLASKLKALNISMLERDEILARYNESIAVLSIDLEVDAEEIRHIPGLFSYKKRAIVNQLAESIWQYVKVNDLPDAPFLGVRRRHTLFIAKTEDTPWYKRRS